MQINIFVNEYSNKGSGRGDNASTKRCKEGEEEKDRKAGRAYMSVFLPMTLMRTKAIIK